MRRRSRGSLRVSIRRMKMSRWRFDLMERMIVSYDDYCDDVELNKLLNKIIDNNKGINDYLIK